MTAIRYILNKGSKRSAGALQLSCRVKPGASSKREGITAVSDDAIELCVSAQAREGEANKAVVKLLAEVLSVPKSDIEIIKGTKSREKTVVVQQPGSGLSESEIVQKALKTLSDNAEGS